MKKLAFDHQKLTEKLGELAPRGQALFAAMVATRLLPNYQQFHLKTGRGDLACFVGLVARLWEYIKGPDLAKETLKNAELVAESLIPSSEDQWDEETQAYAEDAATALTYAFRACHSDDAQAAAWAGQCAYESLDQYLIRQQPRQPFDSDYEETILAHPLIQQELERQQRDIADCAAWDQAGQQLDFLETLSERSQRESSTFFYLGWDRKTESEEGG